MKITTLLAPAIAIGAGVALVARANKQGEPYSFRGKSVLITGGSRGLGLVMARMLSDEGANLTILARNQEELDSAQQDVESWGGKVLALSCDVTDKEQAQSAVRQAVERFGSIDVLINNAGVIQVGPFDDMTLEDFEQAMASHLWGPLYTIIAALPYMRKQRGGRIVNISSIGGKIAVPHLLPYSTSKFALTGLSDGLRAELAKDKIKVTTVAPGLMRTGSPVNAQFKGQHEKEYAWFSVSDSLSVSSVAAERAARQIIEACRIGRPDLTITIQARAAVVAGALFPNLFARAMQLMNAVLPRPAASGGGELKSGWESQSPITRSVLVQPTLEAARRNNEQVLKRGSKT